MNILIIDDELIIAEMLKEMLFDLGYEIKGIAKNFDEFVSLINIHKSIDLCFVDINLEEQKSGFDVAKIISQRQIPFVFLTSYSDKKTVMEAAIYQPEAYLVKPFSSTDLLTTVEIIRGKRSLSEPIAHTITIKDSGLGVKVDIRDILWMKSDNVYVELKTKQKLYLIRSSLEKFVEEINDPAIFRTHRSYAVNFREVNAVNGQFLIVDGTKIPISRKFREEIHEKFTV